MGGFQTIMADPPWDYGNTTGPLSATDFNPDGTKRGTSVGVDSHYPTMSIDALCKLAVKEMAAENAHLYLWFTNAFAEEAHVLARAWGFKPKTILTWVKVKRDEPTPSMKTGFYYRGATEHMLFCVRGRVRTTQAPPRPTAYLLPREPHSVKPQFFYDLAREQSPGPYLEIFARRRRPEWEAWGNEVDSSVVISPPEAA